MASKLVTDRQKGATLVIAAAKTHAERITAAATKILGPHLERGQKLPDFSAMVAAAARALEDARDKMIEADEAHLRELADDQGPRDDRDQTAAELADRLAAFREVLTGVHGKDAAAIFGLNGPTPRDPVQLARYAGMLADRLLSAPKLPPSRVRGAKLVPREWAEEFGALRRKLDASLAKVAKEIRESEATLEAKNKAVEAYDATFTRIADFLSALLLLAGDDALAERVKPSPRRPGQAAEVDETEASAPEPATAA